MTQLENNYISVKYSGLESYGGNQRNSSDPVIRKCGCGIVAALDTLLYMSRNYRWSNLSEFEGIPEDGALPEEIYDRIIILIKKSYFPVLYPFGTSGPALAVGMNHFFAKHCLPFHARWCAFGRGFWNNIETMLAAEIPVIASVGANFPKVWEKKGLRLKISDHAGKSISAASARAHFVTVTGLNEEWMQVSSWGIKYMVSRSDFERYTRENSSPLLCGILYIGKK